MGTDDDADNFLAIQLKKRLVEYVPVIVEIQTNSGAEERPSCKGGACLGIENVMNLLPTQYKHNIYNITNTISAIPTI